MTTPLPTGLDVEHSDQVATVWLDRPDRLNAMGPEFWKGFPEVMGALAEDSDTRAVVIAGRGDAFTVGIDLTAFGTLLAADPGEDRVSTVASRLELYTTIKSMQHTFTAVAECPLPVIAAVHGYCIGGGIDLITACDIRLASRDAIFSVRETKLAIVADVGTLQRLPSIVNPGALADIVYTGRDFDAGEAAELGLVTRLYDDRGALLKGALDLAGQIAANSPLAVQGAKSVMAAARRASVEAELDYVALWNAAFLQSNDLAEAMAAHRERRPPSFGGN